MFSSQREKTLWTRVIFLVVLIYSTQALAGTLVKHFSERGMIDDTFFAAFLIVSLVILISGFVRKQKPLEVMTGIGVATVGILVLLRAGTDLEHRTHLFEYGFLSLLIYLAMSERRRVKGSKLWVTSIVVWLSAAMLGMVDEVLQLAIPGRGFQWVDIGFNIGAATATVIFLAGVDFVREKLKR